MLSYKCEQETSEKESETCTVADKGSVTRSVCKYIQENIEAGQWEVGQKIPSENELCAALGVSRVSVRSALQQFIALGVLKSVRGKGTFLISNDLSIFQPAPDSKPQQRETVDDMKYIIEFRSLIEPSLCAKAAEVATPELIKTLSGLLTQMKASIGQGRTYIQADVEFHLEIARINGNPVTVSIMQEVFQRRKNLGEMYSLANGYYGGIYYHGLILDAIKKHDPKAAKALMLEHLQRDILDMEATV